MVEYTSILTIVAVIMLLVCLSSCVYLFASGGLFPKIFKTPQGLGEDCTLHTDCKGWGSGPTDIACCENKCTKKMKDWAGIGYCPDECIGTPAGEKGTCGAYHWPRIKGEPCTAHTDCKGWGPGATAMACCKGKCTQKKKDWAGTGYCPSECVGGIGKKPGTC